MPPYLVASVLTAWPIADAPRKAFSMLWWYIFGDNRRADEIAMTAPVTTQAVSQNIAMTAPVATNEVEWWLFETTFTMPAKRTLETLPIPNNKQVTISQKPASKKAIRTFSWFANEKDVEKEWIAFEEALTKNDISRTWSYTLAQYNDPRTPWWMRKNELWVDITDPINAD